MDIKTTLVGVLIIAICIFPIVVLSIRKKRNERIKLQSLRDFADLKSCIIHEYEICGNYLIGIDNEKKVLFFETTIVEFVNLAEIKKCSIKNSSRRVESKSGSYLIVDKLQLWFTPHDKNKTETCFEFYDAENNTQLVGEWQSIEKWHKIVNDKIRE